MIQIEQWKQGSIEDLDMEMVERKGRGHPDTLCDAAVETLSRKLSRYYLDHYGLILHHNVDKCSLAGGRSEPKLGGGEVLEPIYMCVIGRATVDVLKGNQIDRVPIGILTREAVLETFEESVRNLKTRDHLQIDSKVHSGSGDLVGLFDHKDEIPFANDTSFGVSYAPFSETENLVYQTEQYLLSDKILKKIPAIGEDIKVMGLRQGKKIKLTIATAMVAKECPDIGAYVQAKKDIENTVLDLASNLTAYEVEVDVNQADIIDKGIVYITVTGTSAECGDDGQVGRGNRVNGLITPCRPMSLEASAGKNPVSHVGKIYNVLAGVIAQKIVDGSDAKEAYVRILSQIGKPITEPLVAHASVLVDEGVAWNTVQNDAEAIVETELKNVCDLTKAFLERKVTLY